MCRKLKLDPYITSYNKVSLKGIKNPGILPETIKYTEENMSKMLQNLGLKGIFNDLIPLVKATKETNKTTLHQKFMHDKRYMG